MTAVANLVKKEKGAYVRFKKMKSTRAFEERKESWKELVGN